ncbi:AI-2E family transporter [Bacillus sp. HMF5848]|uniref:AI-2E family transporter n=1 Tax=Bacillus sp. HMF5848 TaxID=2495421 RepID=UPI000F791BE0|nr:AI-2E family transporter [Bacillus sp. HMF5848]RSK27966.1 AI-2E family transporter [Bacillus sp. HMF5848]
MTDTQMIWIKRIVMLLLIFLALFMFMKLMPIWLPVVRVFLFVLTPFAIGAFVTYLLHPIVEKIHAFGMPRVLAILFIYSLFFGGIGYSVYQFMPVITKQSKELVANLPNLIDSYQEWLLEIDERTENLPNSLHEQIETNLNMIEEKVSATISNVIEKSRGIFSGLFVLALVPFIAFYLLKDFDELKHAAKYVTPKKWRRQLHTYLHDVDESLGRYIRGQLLVCVVIGGAASVAFWLIGMQYPLLLGVVVGITNVIPYFGPIIGAIPAVIIAFTISIKTVIFVIIIIVILQLLEGNVLSPLIVGKSLHMHPVIIMFALLLGGEIAGVLGLIVAVPIFAILRVTLIHLRDNVSSDKSN